MMPELAVHRAGLAARAGPSMKPRPRFFASSYSSLREACRGRGVVHEDGAFLHAREGAVIAITPEPVVVVSDAHHDELAVPGCLARVGADLPPYSLAHCCALAAVRL